MDRPSDFNVPTPTYIKLYEPAQSFEELQAREHVLAESELKELKAMRAMRAMGLIKGDSNKVSFETFDELQTLPINSAARKLTLYRDIIDFEGEVEVTIGNNETLSITSVGAFDEWVFKYFPEITPNTKYPHRD